MFLSYLSPRSIHHFMSAFQNQSAPLSKKAQNFEQEGLSIVIGQINHEVKMQINLPLETTQTLISPLIRLFTQGKFGSQ